MFALRVVAVAAALAAVGAVVYEGGPFREEAVCAVDGRLVGACKAPSAGACVGPADGGSCGLPGGEQRCCAPAAKPPPAAHGQRSREECIKLRDAKHAKSCDNFRAPAEGSIVREGDFPYFAAVGYSTKAGTGKTQWACGGALISENYVLTGAVCAKGTAATGAPKKVRLGDTDLRSPDGDSNAQEFDVAEIINHPDADKFPHYNDIALLKLAGKVKYTSAVRPACLYTEARFPVERATAAGTGTTLERTNGQLNKVDVPIIPNDKCNEIYKGPPLNLSLPEGVVSTMLCAGEKGKDTCTGDSGAPLVLKASAPDCAYQIIAITSFGPSPCASKPGVYTRVYPYLPWIEHNVWK